MMLGFDSNGGGAGPGGPAADDPFLQMMMQGIDRAAQLVESSEEPQAYQAYRRGTSCSQADYSRQLHPPLQEEGTEMETHHRLTACPIDTPRFGDCYILLLRWDWGCILR